MFNECVSDIKEQVSYDIPVFEPIRCNHLAPLSPSILTWRAKKTRFSLAQPTPFSKINAKVFLGLSAPQLPFPLLSTDK